MSRGGTLHKALAEAHCGAAADAPESAEAAVIAASHDPGRQGEWRHQLGLVAQELRLDDLVLARLLGTLGVPLSEALSPRSDTHEDWRRLPTETLESRLRQSMREGRTSQAWDLRRFLGQRAREAGDYARARSWLWPLVKEQLSSVGLWEAVYGAYELALVEELAGNLDDALAWCEYVDHHAGGLGGAGRKLVANARYQRGIIEMKRDNAPGALEAFSYACAAYEALRLVDYANDAALMVAVATNVAGRREEALAQASRLHDGLPANGQSAYGSRVRLVVAEMLIDLDRPHLVPPYLQRVQDWVASSRLAEAEDIQRELMRLRGLLAQ